MKYRAPVFLFFVASLSGCASTDTGIVKITDDTYMSSRLGSFTTFLAAEVKAGLYKDATEFCGKQGKKMEPIADVGSDSGFATYASAEIKFRCR